VTLGLSQATVTLGLFQATVTLGLFQATVTLGLFQATVTLGLFQATVTPRQPDAQLWHEADFTATSSVTIRVICTELLSVSVSIFMLCLQTDTLVHPFSPCSGGRGLSRRWMPHKLPPPDALMPAHPARSTPSPIL